jgi:HAD superfamily hydrolase (TIGR01509 family)
VTAFDFAPRIRAVLFDAGNTLLWIDHARVALALTQAGLPCDEAAVRDAEMRARPLLDPFLVGATRREGIEVVRRYAALVVENLVHARSSAGAAPDFVAGLAAIEAVWPSLWVRPPADAHSTIAELRRRGYRTGVVSNSTGNVRSLLGAAGYLPLLECVIDSGLVGVEKPDPRIFALACDALGLPPGACAYVGDFLSLDVLGARAAGMHGVLLDPIGAWAVAVAARESAAASASSDSAATSAAAAVARIATLADLLARLPGPPSK